MKAIVMAALLLGPGPTMALAQAPCGPSGPLKAALARVSPMDVSVPPGIEPGASHSVHAIVGDGVLNTFESQPVEQKVIPGQQVTVCGDDGAEDLVAELTNATIRMESATCEGVKASTMLEGQVVLRAPDTRRLKGASSGRKQLYADAAGGLFLSALVSAEPSPDIALAIDAIATRLRRDARIAGWGVTDRRGAAVLRVLYSGDIPEREQFSAVSGIPVTWTRLPRGAFEGRTCAADQ